MLRVLFVVLFMAAAVRPGWAGPQEDANALFVESVQLIQAAGNEPDVEVRLEYLMEAQKNLHSIIDDYPSSDLAVQLITGQSIGSYSLDSVQFGVEWAYGEALEERARNAAVTAEGLLSQLAATQTREEGHPIAEEATSLLAKLQSNYGTTDYLKGLRYRLDVQRTASLEKWARSAAKPIELMIDNFSMTETPEEAEPIITAIDADLTIFSKLYRSTIYFNLLVRKYDNVKASLLNKRAEPWAARISEMIAELQTTRTPGEGSPIISRIEAELDLFSEEYGSTKNYSQARSAFKNEVVRREEAWATFAKELLDVEIASVDDLLEAFGKSKSNEDADAIVDAINQLVAKYGWVRSLRAVRIRLERKLEQVGQSESILHRLQNGF